MNKLIIAFDISFDSTGVCFRKDGQNFFYNYTNIYKYTSSKKDVDINEIASGNKILTSLQDVSNLQIEIYKKVRTNTSDAFFVNQRKQIRDAMSYSISVVGEIKRIIKRKFADVDTKDIYILFESISYGSNTNNIAQVMEVTTLLKSKLLEEVLVGNVDNYFSIPSPSIKAWVGNGSFDKYRLFGRFIKNFHSDAKLEADSFYQTLKINQELYLKGNLLDDNGREPKKNDIVHVDRDLPTISLLDPNSPIAMEVRDIKKTGTKNKKVTYFLGFGNKEKEDLHEVGEFYRDHFIVKKPKIEVLAPINDIIDAYFIAFYFERNILPKLV